MNRTIGLALLALSAACAKENQYQPPPPPTVTVATPEQRDVVEYAVFTGITAAHEIVEIRARVPGYLERIAYEPGELVEKGRVLFQIDPAEFEATVRTAAANLESAESELGAAKAVIASAEALLALAETAVQKLKKAYESRAVSEILVLEVKAKRDVAEAELDQAKAALEVTQARIGIAKARLDRAKLDLDWTTIRAPMRGRVAMWSVFEGDLVGSSGPTLLTTMYNDEKVFCYFDVSERWVLDVRQRIRAQKGRPAEPADLEIELALANEEEFTHVGIGDYAEPTLNAETGTLRARAVYENKERLIPSGAFARVRFPVALRKDALLVTERALGTDQSGDFLLVVNSKNVVERHEVQLGPREKGQVVIERGLRPEDRVIVSGLQRARPGAVVKAETERKKP